MLIRILIIIVLSVVTPSTVLPAADSFQEQRLTMVTRDIRGRGISDRQVCAAPGPVAPTPAGSRPVKPVETGSSDSGP